MSNAPQDAGRAGASHLPASLVAHARAPLRLGLAGGGTDVAPYSDLFGGQVLNATIGLFTHCHLRLLKDSKTSLFVADDFGIQETLPVQPSYAAEGRFALHKAVYNRIVRDPRHQNVTLLHYAEVAERRFSGWTMGQVNLARINPSIVLKYSERPVLDPFRVPGDVSMAMLEELIATASIVGRAV